MLIFQEEMLKWKLEMGKWGNGKMGNGVGPKNLFFTTSVDPNLPDGGTAFRVLFIFTSFT
ncbi:hypothetical protein MHK_005527 [Candidatus Magnetomorum sp. HK-1]|nr:hypothetical protein MHK_005527 [Candidatus Magnetomorum sp. HK-1]